MAGEVSPAIENPPDRNSGSSQRGLVQDDPGPDDEGARLAIQVGADAADAWHAGDELKSVFDSTQNGLSTLDAAV